MRTVRRNSVGPGMKSLTGCQTNNNRVGVRVVRKHPRPAGWGMKSLTFYQVIRIRGGVRTLSKHPSRPGTKSLTSCQANGTRAVGVRTVRRQPAEPGMKSLTRCQANRVRVGVRKVRMNPAGPGGMKLLTCCQANRTRVEWGQSESTQLDLAGNYSLPIKATESNTVREQSKGTCWTCQHKITNKLSNQYYRTRVKEKTVSLKATSWACQWHKISYKLSSQQDQSGQSAGFSGGMKALTCCQANRAKGGVRTVIRHLAGPIMKSPTSYQTNKMRGGMRTVRRHPVASPGMKSLTCYQANKTRVGVRIIRRHLLDLTWDYSLAVKPTEPVWEWGQSEGNH